MFDCFKKGEEEKSNTIQYIEYSNSEFPDSVYCILQLQIKSTSSPIWGSVYTVSQHSSEMLKLCLLLIAAPSLGLAASSSHLRKALFQNYDKLTRPDHQVELEYGLSVTRLDLCHHKDVNNFLRPFHKYFTYYS